MLKFLLIFLLLFSSLPVHALANTQKGEDKNIERMALYRKMEALTQIPWYFLAGVDQYERSLRLARKDREEEKGVIGIYYPHNEWSGYLNPNQHDTNPISISMFGGIGKDGNGDGIANREDDEDLLYTFSDHIATYGTDPDSVAIALWEYYQREQAVNIVMGNAKLFKHYGSIALEGHAFPVPLHANYSYRSTWGARRGWGGLRIHEGTDIFANYGVPVRATSHGIVEMKGWNRFGGWRIGIRDLHNNYHYFAHLRGFSDVKVGQIVEPGTIIGYVGSSGYGKPGTQGKFPPHLHYGIYKDNGVTEWSYDPYPKLRAWERQERLNKKRKK